MKTDIDTIPNLYSIAGNILDINTVLINREELRRQHQEITELKKAKEELLEVLDKVICFGGLSLDLWQEATAVLNSHKG